MVSIVVVYNDEESYRSNILLSLQSQNSPYELIPVNNSKAAFSNAASALNWGAKQAKGDWVLFVHQDVVLLSPSWLDDAELMLGKCVHAGWVGVAGVVASGEMRMFLRDGSMLKGLPFDGPAEVQTLDEVLLLHRRRTNGDPYFDECVPGWHAYGVEACCRAIRSGERNYVIPLPIWHNSPATNREGLKKSHDYVWQKHGSVLGAIRTTCGDLPPGAAKGEAPVNPSPLFRAWRRFQIIRMTSQGFDFRPDLRMNGILEEITQGASTIECVHEEWADQGPIRAASFSQELVTGPRYDRTITHYFAGLGAKISTTGSVVIAPDITSRLVMWGDELESLRAAVPQLILCCGRARIRGSKLWTDLVERARRKWLTYEESAGEVQPFGVFDVSRV